MKTTTPYQQFQPLPSEETLRLAWPTPSRWLGTEPERYCARTRVNPDFGRPGWTRDCGRRFHRGCDIAPVSVTPTGRTIKVIFTDCATNRDFESEEPTFVPHDEVFCVCEGVLQEIVIEESASDFGRHLVIEHTWPASGRKFYTLYAHLAQVLISRSSPFAPRSSPLGSMGQTSRSADARNWMAIAPHLHFEVWDEQRRPYDPLEFLRAYLPPEG